MAATISDTEPSTRTAMEVVEAFLVALGDLDVGAVLALTHAEISYQNVPLPPIRGLQAFERTMRFMDRTFTGFEAINHNIAENGAIVLTERTDIIELGRFRVKLWVCGTFEVQDGKVVLWRDYFDYADATIAALKGLLGMVLPRR